MNIVLFEPTEIDRPLPRSDPRARHLLNVLRRKEGDTFDVGCVNGPRGRAVLRSITATQLECAFSWSEVHPPPAPTHLAVGFPRPQTARDILREASSLGTVALNFVTTHRSDPNYPASSLWSSGQWRRHALTGVAQAFDTHLPEVRWTESLGQLLRRWSDLGITPLVLDVYGDHPPLGDCPLPDPAARVGVLIGPERGWAAPDRALCADGGAVFTTLGDRVLRTETAVVAALTLINAARARSGR